MRRAVLRLRLKHCAARRAHGTFSAQDYPNVIKSKKIYRHLSNAVDRMLHCNDRAPRHCRQDLSADDQEMTASAVILHTKLALAAP
jgi:hypothetical protein